jgi:uncharacterized protein (DUF2237 family)
MSLNCRDRAHLFQVCYITCVTSLDCRDSERDLVPVCRELASKWWPTARWAVMLQHVIQHVSRHLTAGTPSTIWCLCVTRWASALWPTARWDAPSPLVSSTLCTCVTSLNCRDSERDLVPVCRELGIGIVAYSPLGWSEPTNMFVTCAGTLSAIWCLCVASWALALWRTARWAAAS